MTDGSAEHALYYSDSLIDNLQLRWGEGFMSPGGATELRRMFTGIDLKGASILDLGCGIGGYDRLLAAEHGAGKVTGIDIDAASVAAARAMAAANGLDDRLAFKQVEPGPLPFGDGSFDVAFSKDSIVDIPDKAAVLSELYRVVKPGGHIVVSDWFRSAEPYSEEMRAWATTGDETYEMDMIENAAAYLREAGFADVATDDRNGWFRDLARDEYERLKGPLFATYVEKFGEEQARSSVENARIRWLLAEQGQLRPGHVRGRKP
jgi:phosphoethanolamine N-methyltransferase